MEGLERILREHRFFAGLPDDVIATLAGCAKNLRFEAGDFLLREGDPADTFFLVRGGKVAVELHDPARGGLGIRTAMPGDVVGWSWLFPPHRWRFDARALETVRASGLDGACLRAKIEADPALGFQLMQRFTSVIVGELMAARLQLLDMYGGRDA